MKITKTLYVTNKKTWRAWLKRHHTGEKEIWLVFPKKSTGKPRIPYNDAVEEALCFGWIDSIVKGIDETRFAQRFSPRNPTTSYSQTNKERLKKLIKEGKVLKSVRANLHNVQEATFTAPADILREIKKNKEAWKNFQKFSERYKRIRIGFIAGAHKRPTEFKKRLAYFIKMTAQGKQYGFGGIQKYF